MVSAPSVLPSERTLGYPDLPQRIAEGTLICAPHCNDQVAHQLLPLSSPFGLFGRTAPATVSFLNKNIENIGIDWVAVHRGGILAKVTCYLPRPAVLK